MHFFLHLITCSFLSLHKNRKMAIWPVVQLAKSLLLAVMVTGHQRKGKTKASMWCYPPSLRLLWVWSISCVECSFCVLSSPQWVSVPGIYPVSPWVLVNLYHPIYPLGAGFVALPLTGQRAVSFCYSATFLQHLLTTAGRDTKELALSTLLVPWSYFARSAFWRIFPFFFFPCFIGRRQLEKGKDGVCFTSIPYTQLSISLFFKHPVFKFNISYSDTFTVFHHNLHTTVFYTSDSCRRQVTKMTPCLYQLTEPVASHLWNPWIEFHCGLFHFKPTPNWLKVNKKKFTSLTKSL